MNLVSLTYSGDSDIDSLTLFKIVVNTFGIEEAAISIVYYLNQIIIMNIYYYMDSSNSF